MKFALLLSALSIAATAQAGKIFSSKGKGSKSAAVAAVDTETVYVVEYTEICVCPATTPVIPAITTVTCCESCAPVPITATTQYVTSCTTSYKPTTTVCPTEGVYKCGDNFVPCHNAPCTIEYNAPCPTCYACAYNDCWAPGAMVNSKPKKIEVIEYFGDVHVGSWHENWFCKTWDEVVTKTKHFAQPTIFIENNITINITVAPTIVTYTATSTYTTTSTTTVTASENPISRGTTAAPSSAVITASSTISSVPSAQPSTPGGINIAFVLKSGSHAGNPVIITDNKLAYTNSTSATSAILHLINGQLFDSDGNIIYISENDLTDNGKSRLYFIDATQVPSDGLTTIFSTDSDGDLVVIVHGVQLTAIICGDDGFIMFGNDVGSCEAVELGPYAAPNSSGVSTPYSSTVPASSAAPSDAPSSAIPSDAPSSAAPSDAPSSAAPSDAPSSAPAPSSSPSAQSSVTPSEAPSSAASIAPSSAAPSDAPSSAPSVAPSEGPSSAASDIPSSASPSTPPSAVPTYDHYVPVVSPYDTDAVFLNQGYGTSLGSDTALVQVTAYDQFNNPFPGAIFAPECATDKDLCKFALAVGGPAVPEGVTDVNGVLQFFLSAMKAHNTTFTLTGPDGILPSVKLAVKPVIDCSATTIELSESKQLDSLILGVDKPVLVATTYDLNGDPMYGNVVAYDFTVDSGLKKRGPERVATTDYDGVASYLLAGDTTIPGVYSWTATPNTCPSSSYTPYSFNYGIDCASSNVVVNATTLSKSDTLTVSGTYVTSDPSAVIQGSYININLAGTLNLVYLNTDGTFTASFPYQQSYGNAMTFSVDFPWAYPLCNDKASQIITWTDPVPSCGVGGSAIVLESNHPSADGGAGTVSGVLTSRDNNGNKIPSVPYSITATDRPNQNQFTYSGTTDVNGEGTFVIQNNNYGVGGDPLEIYIGNPPDYCTYSYNDLVWVPDEE